jgi:hypothetical protein
MNPILQIIISSYSSGNQGGGGGNPYAIFGYGHYFENLSMTNLVSNTGVVSADVTGVGTARHSLAAASFG